MGGFRFVDLVAYFDLVALILDEIVRVCSCSFVWLFLVLFGV